MATLLLLTNDMHAAAEILPALELLPHQVKVAQAEATALLDAPAADVILLDARRDLVGARSLCRLMETTGKESPLLVIVSEGGLAALSADWGFDDLLLATSGPAEVDVRLRLAMNPNTASAGEPLIQTGNIVIDEAGYSAKLNGAQLDLTYTEFELLKYLAQHPGRLLRRNPHRRRPRPPATRQARPGVRVGDRDRTQRRVPLRHPHRRTLSRQRRLILSHCAFGLAR
jgi:DNA-binding response OmpR family regulator